MTQFDTRIKMKSDTTENWNSHKTFVPLAGEIIIYTDYETITVDGNIVNIPSMKIGDGNTYCVDLPFVGDNLKDTILAHISDTDAHTTQVEKDFWDNKINVSDSHEVVDNVLIFNRN